MAGWLWRTSCPPENVYWVLINSVENPSFLRGQVRVPPPDAVVAGLPRRTNLTVPEYVSKCAARAVAILEKDAGDGQTARVKRLRKLVSPEFVEKQILHIDWDMLAQWILKCLDSYPHPGLQREIQEGIANEAFRYRKAERGTLRAG